MICEGYTCMYTLCGLKIRPTSWTWDGAWYVAVPPCPCPCENHIQVQLAREMLQILYKYMGLCHYLSAAKTLAPHISSHCISLLSAIIIIHLSWSAAGSGDQKMQVLQQGMQALQQGLSKWLSSHLLTYTLMSPTLLWSVPSTANLSRAMQNISGIKCCTS